MPSLKVNNAPNTTKITINNSKKSSGLGISNYNPQKAAPVPRSTSNVPVQTPAPIPKAAPAVNVQPAASTTAVSRAASIRVPSAAEVAAAAQRLRIAQAAIEEQRQIEVARQKEQRRIVVQGQVDSKTQANKSAIKLSVSTSMPKWQLSVDKSYKLPKIELPAQTEYDKEYAKAYKEAMAEYENHKKAGKKSFFGKLYDKVSFGQDRRDSSARVFADSKAKETATKNIDIYNKKLNAFISEQAKRKAAIEATKFSTKYEFDKAVADYDAWQTAQINSLEKDRAITTARIDAFGNASQSKLNSAPARAVGWLGTLPQHFENNPIFKYTLGSGSKNVPSLVTAPSRFINLIGNLNTNNRTINQYGGKSINRLGSSLNAWQSTFNQRNFNIKPVVDKPYNKSKAWQELSHGGAPVMVPPSYAFQFNHAKTAKQKDTIARRYWSDRNKALRNQNSLKEIAADPLFAVSGATKAIKSAGWLSKASDVGRATKATSWVFSASDKLKSAKAAATDTKLFKWLGSEYKTPGQQVSEAIDAAKLKSSQLYDEILPQLKKLHDLSSSGHTLDLSVFEDFSSLTDSEAKVLQRMVDGKLSPRDRLFLAGSHNALVRDRLERIAKKWLAFSEQMKIADNVTKTRFGRGKKMYFARVDYSGDHNLENYNFYAKKKSKSYQSATDLKTNQIDRFFKSQLDLPDSTFLLKSQAKLYKKYNAEMQPFKDNIDSARSKLPWYLKSDSKRAKVTRFGVNNTPMKIWKKSVLKYRPAWTVNNILYNTQASFLAGGSRALGEHVKMLNPRYFRKAMDEVPASVKTNLAREIGNPDKLNRFYSGVENFSRVAAWRALKRQGFSDKAALDRVNKYLLDYTTRNWERPIKAFIPFWSFQKGVYKAAAHMPLDRPAAAIAYNRLDRYQQDQYNQYFDSLVPKLKKLGYSDSEIETFRQQNAKYFAGRLKVGNRWFTTPFNAFSEKGMTTAGFNPFIAAAGESSKAVDNFGQPIAGREAKFYMRLLRKFPQADLAQQGAASFLVHAGKSKPRAGWIGKSGHEGYGLTKERQGFNSSKSNYDRKLDPRAKLGQNALAFAGVPRSLQFDKADFIKRKTLQKASEAYFALDTSNLEYDQAEAKRQAIFKKYGITADDFYKGVLAKYDTENTKRIKNLKESAAKANKSLFDEYMKQPKGTRNLWATNKLRELVAGGYFNDNPFKKSFKWITPDTVANADKQALVLDALKTGDWSKYRAKYGTTQKQKDYEYAKSSGDWSAWRAKYGIKSSKAKAYVYASSTGDWSKYRAKYGTKTSQYSYNGKYFKTAESRQKYIDGEFWKKYFAASKEDRKKLLADNPQYNTRGNWTRAQWTSYKNAQAAKEKTKLRGWGSISLNENLNRAMEVRSATRFRASRKGRVPKVTWRLSQCLSL